MIILILDDQDIRHDTVERYLSKEHTVLHAFNALEALEIIKSYNGRIGLAMLDHDLQDIVTEDGRKYERHGVYFLAEMFKEIPEDKWPARFILHSHNNVGVKNMLDDLTRMGQIVSVLNFSSDNVKYIAEMIRPQ